MITPRKKPSEVNLIHAMKRINSTFKSALTSWSKLIVLTFLLLLSAVALFAQSDQTTDFSSQSGTTFTEPTPGMQASKEAGELEAPDVSVPFDGEYLDVRTIVEESEERDGDCWQDFDPAVWTQFTANDDGSVGPISLPFTFDLYGTAYNSVYLNNNGNITFDNGYWWHSPYGFPISTPMIAPFWGDVDTRLDNGEVWYYVDDHAFYATWVAVGPYSAYSSYSDGLENSFQVVITDGTDPILSVGNNIGFAYGTMGWTTGAASGGSSGFGGTPATVGVNFGDGVNFIQLGLFDGAEDTYDGPADDNDGVAWLNNQCFEMDASTPGNAAPVAQGFPTDNTLYTCSGTAVSQTFAFIDMDPGESVTITLDDQGNTDYSVLSNTTGTTASTEISFNHSSPGTYTYVLTGTDNNYAPESTSITVSVVVSAPPSATLIETDASCDLDNGEIQLSFSDDGSQDQIQFSLDNGSTWETAVNDNVGSVTYSNLAAGTYTVLARWNASSCEASIGIASIANSGGELPTLTCSGDQTVADTGDDCEEIISIAAPTISGGCSAETYTRNYMTFDGSNDYGAVENFYYSTAQAEITVEAWIRTSDGSNQIISSFDRSDYWRLGIDGNGASTGEVSWCVKTNTGITDLGSETRIDDGEWHHVAGVYDDGTVAIYIDGVLDISTTSGSTVGNNTTRYGFVGTGSEATSYNGSTGPNDYFNGDMAGFRIWSKALTVAEMTSEFCPAGDVSGLQVEYDFTEGSGSVLNDTSGNGRNANLINVDAASIWQNGDAPGCIEFTNDFNNTADASGTYGAGETTVTWTYATPDGSSVSCSQLITITVAEDVICENEFNDYVWDGELDTDWNNAGNWVGNEVPPTQANVLIAVVNYPPELAQTVSVNNIMVDENSSIEFTNSSGQVKIYGDFVNNGTIDVNRGKFWFAGSDLQLIKGNNIPTFNELKISSSDTVKLMTNINLVGAMQPNSGVFDWNGKEVTLLSDDEQTGSIGEIKSSAEIVGTEITYNRYFPAGPGSWRMMCSPIVNATFEQWNDDFPTTGFVGSDYPTYPSAADPWSNIRVYDETVTEGDLHSGFVSVDNITDVIGNSSGYFVYFIPNSTTIDMQGTFHKGDLTYSLTQTVSNTDAYNDGWNLIANPYPSAIDWDYVLGWDKTDVDDAIYAFDPINNQYGSYINGISVGTLDNRVASFQAFWVKANGPNPAITIKEKAKSNASGVFMRSQDMDTQSVIRIKLESDEQNKYDETVVGLHYGADVAFESNLDAYKFFGNNPALPSLATVPDSTENRPMSITMVPVPEEDMVINLLVRPGENVELTLTNTMVDSYEGNICLQLEDRLLNVMNPFNMGDSYTFTCDADMPEDRFALHVSAPVDATPFHESCPEADNGSVIVQGFGEAPWSFTWTDEMGNVFRETENLFTADTAEDLPPGFYEVLVENTDANCNSSTAMVQVEASPQPFVEMSSTPASCNQESDGTISFFASEDFTWDITMTSYEDGSVQTLNAISGDSTTTDLLYGVYMIHALSNCGTEIEIENADLRDDHAVFADFVAVNPQISLSQEESATFLEQCSSNITSVLWDFGDGTQDSLNFNPTHTYTEAGMYTVTLTAKSDQCEEVTEGIIVVTGITPTGNDNLGDMAGFEMEGESVQTFDVLITSQEIMIGSPEPVDEPVLVTIFSLTGQLVMTEQLPQLNTGQTTVNISSLDPGVYSMSMSTDQEILHSQEFSKN